ncbi:MAG: hypothetical protein L6R42_006460 [Xanthoria sp. 1 TBL-2021]|nr:MAG: hypothetical protein L6R42_006460 [Xanthoria sp. 1 TBL-2021]
MSKFGEKCKQLFQRKESVSTDGAENTQSPKSRRARNVLRKVRRNVSRFAKDTTETIVAPKRTKASIEDASDAVLEPLGKSVEHTSLPTSISDSPMSPEQTCFPDQGVMSPGDCFPQQRTTGQADQLPAPAAVTTESDVPPEQVVSETKIPQSGEESCLAAAPENSHLLDVTVVLSPPDATDSPKTSNGDSQARYTSSCYSTPTPKSRFHHTPDTSRSPESTYLSTPHDRNSYLKLLDDSFRCSTAAGTPDRHITSCSPCTTNTKALGIFERSVGNGPEGPTGFLSLAQVLVEHAEPKKEGAIMPTKGAAEGEPANLPSHDAAVKDDEPAGDKAGIESEPPSAWERAMESQEQSFQNEIEDLKEDHAAEVGELKETIAELEKEAEAAKSRKAYVERVANKKIADISKEKDADEMYYAGLLNAAECEMSDKLREKVEQLRRKNEQLQEKDDQLQEKDEQLQEKDAKVKRQNEWAVTTSAWNTELKHEFDDTKLNVVRPLQQEVARLTALDLENQQRISYQSSQITFLRNTQARVQNSEAQLLPKLLDACKERDQYKADLGEYSGRYEQKLRDLTAAQRDIHGKEQRLQNFNYENEDQPHLTEAAGLLVKTREAYQGLEKKANECLFREQEARKSHEQDKKTWKLNDARKQKIIDSLGAKIVLLETSNARLVNDLEQRVGHDHGHGELDDRLSFLYKESRHTVGELQTYVSQQETQIAAQEKEIHQHKMTISLHTRILEDKDIEVHSLREEKSNAERQIEEIQTKADEREIVSANELGKAADEIDWYQTQLRNYQSQIQGMTERGVPAALIEIHQAEIQELQQYIADLEKELWSHRARQQEQNIKDWHDANAAAGSERASQILRLNWENANEEVRKLKQEVAVLRQGGDPRQFEIAEQMATAREEREQLQERLQVSEQKTESVVVDVLVLGDLAGKMWKSLQMTWARDGEAELLTTLGPVAEEINGVMGKYDGEGEGDGDGEEGVEDSAEVEDDGEEVEDLDQGADGYTTSPAAQDGSAFHIPSSRFRDSWSSGHDVFSSTDENNVTRRAEESHHTSTHASYRPGYTFTAPSSSSSDSSTHTSSLLIPGNGHPNNSQNQERSAPEPLDSHNPHEHISNTKTTHKSFDPVNIDNHINLEDDDTLTPGYPEQSSLIPYQPTEKAEVELITQAAYDLIFPIPPLGEMLEGPVEWGHETLYAPQANQYRHNGDDAREEYGGSDGLEEYRDEDGQEEQEGTAEYTEEDLDELIAEFTGGNLKREGEGDLGVEVGNKDEVDEVNEESGGGVAL